MNDADRTPSPNRFCRKLGIFSAALNAPAAGELPRECAKTRTRMSPAMRLSRIPAATSTAKPAARGFAFAGTSGGVASAVIDYGRQAYCGIRAETARYHTATVPNHGLIRIAGAGPSGLAAAIVLARAGREVEVHEAKGDVGTRFIGDLQIIEGASETEPVPAFLDRLGIERNFYFRGADWATFYDHHGRGRVIRSNEPYGYFIHRGAEEGTLDRGLLAQAQRSGAKVVFNSRLSADQADIVATGPASPDGLAKEMTWHVGRTLQSDRLTRVG